MGKVRQIIVCFDMIPGTIDNMMRMVYVDDGQGSRPGT